MNNNRIVIGYFNSDANFYDNIVITRHKYINDLRQDLERMSRMLDDKTAALLSGKIVRVIGYVDDETGELTNSSEKTFIIQFPEYREVKEAK